MNKQQVEFLRKIGVNPDAELDVIEDQVGEYLALHGLDKDYNPTSEGLICENILDYISTQ